MKLRVSSLLALTALASAGLLGAVPAFAQGQFTGAGSGSTCDPGTGSFDTVSCTKNSVTVNMTAWGYMSAVNTTTAASGFVQGRLGDFGANGFGAYTGNKESNTDSQHAFDNVTANCGTSSGATGGVVPLSSAAAGGGGTAGCGGNVEAMLLNFGTAKVNLTQIGIGFSRGDSDLSIWAWTGGSGGPTMSTQTLLGSTNTTTATTTAGTLAGWALVSNHDMDSPTSQSTGGSLYSSYFLVTTFFGATTSVLNAGDDGFKINSFTANVCAGTLTGGNGGNGGNGATCSTVAEPSSVALAGLAVLGVAATSRRRVAKALRIAA